LLYISLYYILSSKPVYLLFTFLFLGAFNPNTSAEKLLVNLPPNSLPILGCIPLPAPAPPPNLNKGINGPPVILPVSLVKSVVVLVPVGILVLIGVGIFGISVVIVGVLNTVSSLCFSFVATSTIVLAVTLVA